MINKNDYIEILMVEDREEDGELTLMGLKLVANSIKWVKDGVEALDYLFCRGEYKNKPVQQVPKLILLDINLPKVSGLEVLREIRKNPKTKMIPVTILTTSHDERDMFEAYDLGVNSYITKPVNFAKFSETVKDVGLYWLLINKPFHFAD